MVRRRGRRRRRTVGRRLLRVRMRRLKRYRPRGLAALLRTRRRIARGRKDSRLGKLVPIRDILTKPRCGRLIPGTKKKDPLCLSLQEKVDEGYLLPGDPWLTDYKRWQEKIKEDKERWRRQIREKEIPANTPAPKVEPPPGELSDDALTTFQCRYRGERNACCKLEKDKAELDRKKGKQVGRPSCQGPFPSLLDNLNEYVPYMYRKILAKANEYRNPQGKKLDEVVSLLYQYGCKRIDRLMPGFAKIVIKRISPDIDTVGDWDAEISEEALDKPPPKNAPPAGKPYSPPKRPEYVEICTVTHKQLERTLRKDLGIIVQNVARKIAAEKQAAGTELICPLSEANCKKFQHKKVVRKTSWRRPMRSRSRPRRTAMRRTRSPRRTTRSRRGVRRPSRRGRGVRRAAARRRAPPPRRTARRPAQPKRRSTRPQPRRGVKRRPQPRRHAGRRPPTRRRSSRISAQQRAALLRRVREQMKRLKLPKLRRGRLRAKASPKLFDDLGRFRKELTGETSYDIVKRLLSFYRKTGAVRRFRLAKEKIGDKIALLAKNAPEKAKKSMAHHAGLNTVKTRNRRGLLRRQVEQWTYGYEYERLRDFLKEAHKAAKKRDGLVAFYEGVERKELKSFWESCLEIYQLCENPQTPKERQACIACAERAVRDHCIDGTETAQLGGKKNKDASCAGGHVAIAGYAGMSSAKSLEGGRSAQQAKKEEIKRLQAFLEEKKWCIIDWEPHYRALGGGPRRGWWDGHFIKTLTKVAAQGDSPGFAHLWGQWAFPDCFRCSKHGKWHTKHAHCTIECGGNNGLFKGPCFEMCKAGHDIGNWFDTGFKRLIGKHDQIRKGAVFETQVTNELHELRIGKVKPTKGAVQTWPPPRKVTLGDGRNTFLNWLAMQVIAEATNSHFHGGLNVFDSKWPAKPGKDTDYGYYQRRVVQNVVAGKFLPKEADPQKGITYDGMRYLNQLPITPWQRCYLWSPVGEQACSGKTADDFKGNLPWWRSRLFQLVFQVPKVMRYMNQFSKYWRVVCAKKQVAQEYFWFVPIPFTKKQKPVHDCLKKTAETQQVAAQHYGFGSASRPAANLGGAGDAVASAAEPIVGKLIAMLLRAAGMYGTMKTVAKAAGLTPEQSADCEDEEYRRDIMKIPACPASCNAGCQLSCQDTKRGCLLKVFAKNFGSVLESIIVMLGKKLVSWGVDMLRTLLEPLRSALIAAAGSVPFAGGVLAAAINIAWELLMNFGAKEILNGFVIEKLPEWLKIRELANMAMDELMKHDVVRVIAGIILQIIGAAMVHGDKSWMAVGASTILSTIQIFLRKGKEWFWIRALHYAKKELAKEGSGEGGDLKKQLLDVAKAMIGGFGAAVARNLRNPDTIDRFEKAIERIKGHLSKEGLAQIVGKLTSDPIGFLTKFIAKELGPVVIPIVTALVPMDRWATNLLEKVSAGLSDTIADVDKGRLQATTLVARIVDIFEPKEEPDCSNRALCHLLEKLPIDKPLQEMLIKGLGYLTDALRDISKLPAVLGKPWTIVEGLVDLTGGFLKAKVGDLIRDDKLAPERDLLKQALGAILGVLGDPKSRQALFPRGQPDARAILAKLAEVVKPYAKARLVDLASKIGLQDVVGEAVEFLFGPQGPFVAGEAFFRSLPNLLQQKGRQAMAALSKVASGLLHKAIGGGPLGAMAKGILGLIGTAMKSKGGIEAMFRDSNRILQSVTALIGDFLKQAPDLIDDPQLAPEKKLLAGAVDLILKILRNPKQRRQVFSSPMALLSKVAALAKPYLEQRLQALGKGLGMEGPVQAAIEFLLGPQGPFVAGRAFFGRLPGLIKQKAQHAMAEVTRVASGLIQDAIGELGKGPLGSVVRGILASLAGAMKSRGGLAAAFRAPKDILKAARDALQPLVKSLVASLAAKAKALPIPSLLRNVLGGLMKLFDNPQQLVKQGIGALGGLARQVANGLKTVVASLVAKAVSDPGLRGLIGKAVSGFFDLVSNPARLTQLSGAKVLSALGAAGKELFAYLKSKALASLRSAQLSPLAAASQGVLTGVLDTLEKLISAPAKLKALVGGGVKGLIAAAGRTIGPALSSLVQSAVPAGLKQIAKQVLDKVAAFFANPAEIGTLARTTAGGLLAKLAPTLGSVLEGILKTVAPPELAAKVTEAAAKVRAALANPAALLQQAGKAARKVIDDTVASLILRIPDPSLRDVAANLVTLVRDLVTGGTVGDKLRSDVKALLGRLVDVGVRYLTNLLPRGPVQTIVGEVLDGLRALVTGRGDLGQILAQKASSLLPRVLGVMQRLFSDLVQRFLPEPALASVVSGLAGEVVGLIAEPSRYKKLTGQGLGYLLARAVPVFRDFLMAAVGRVTGLGDQARSVISGLFTTLTRIFSNPASIAGFARSAVSSLVSMGVGAVVPLVTDLVQKVGSPALTRFAKRALAGVAGLIQDPAKLRGYFKQPAGKIIGSLLGEAKTLLADVASTLIHDRALKQVATQGLSAVLDFVRQALAGGAGLGKAAKAAIAKVIPAVAGLLKKKLLALFPGHLDSVRQVVAKGFDALVSLGSGLLARGKAAWDELASGGAAGIFGRVIKGVLPMVTGPVLRAIPVPALRKAVGKVLAALTGLIGGTGGKSGKDIMKMFLGQAKTLLGSLAKAYIKDPTVKQVAEVGLGLVVDFVKQAMAGRGGVQAAVKASLAKMIPVVANLLRDKLLVLFPSNLGGLRSLVGDAFDGLVKFGAELVASPRKAWKRLTAGGGSALFGKLIKSVIPLVKKPVLRAVSYRPLQGLLGRLLDAVGDLLGNPGKLIAQLSAGGPAAMKLLLPKLEMILAPFVEQALIDKIPPGLGRDIVRHVVDAGLGFLKDPNQLQKFLREARKPKGLFKVLLRGLIKPLLKSVPSKALRSVFTAGLDVMVKNL